MSFLVDNGGLSKEDGSAGKYLAGVLTALIQAIGLERTVAMWKAASMNIEDFVSKDNVATFASTHVSKETYECKVVAIFLFQNVVFYKNLSNTIKGVL